MTGPQVKSSKPPKLPTQVTNEDEKIFEKEEHQVIYRAFLDTLENPEKQTKQEIEKKKQKLKEELSDQEKQKLQSDLKSLGKLLGQLQGQNEDEKKIFAFVFENREEIFKNINQEDIKLLSEENFLQFLVSVSKKIKKENLAREENLKNGKIKQEVAECVADIRGTEAWDWVVDSAKRKIPLRELLEKIPGLGKVLGVKKEEDEPPLSDEEMVKTFLSKSLLPITLFAFSALIFGTGPIALAISGGLLVWTEVSTIKSLFSNNKKGTLYDPSSQDKDDTEKRAKLNGKILEGIDDILKTPVTGVEKGTPVPEQVTSVGKEKSEQQPVPEQISQVGNEKSEQRDQSWTGKQTKGKTTERQR
ncbi:hypothetical protein [Wolbachia endosymbiont (group A) of Agelastica alni]|uniref:hypothetical protein n=1 Tax=Wolbachia endosymbiont (group A) of Agelastica alni TaxID=3066130 RepID=UPI00313327AD